MLGGLPGSSNTPTTGDKYLGQVSLNQKDRRLSCGLESLFLDNSCRLLFGCYKTRQFELEGAFVWLPAVLTQKAHSLRQLGREEMFLFNDALNTFYLRLYGVGHMVKDHSDSKRGNPLPPHGLLFPISIKGSFMCTILHT